ncbi:MAG: C-terminal helicase domain-containing protein, partial [Gammaproteobacteria bacterium]
RKHITGYYDTSEIGKFPERMKPISHRCRLTDRTDVPELNDIVETLTSLNLAVYAPLNYVFASRRKKYDALYDTELGSGKSIFRHADREKNLQALMTTNLLKRLESSVEAFRITLTKLQSSISNTLDAIARFEDSKAEDALSKIDMGGYGDEDDELSGMESFATGSKTNISLGDMNLTSWKQDLESDAKVINSLLSEMHKIKPADDAKLQLLIANIRQKVANPLNANNKKVLVFTAFADTANYLYEHIKAHLHDQDGLSLGRVSGSDTPKSTFKKTYDFPSLLMLFAPKAKERDLIMSDCTDDLDILIGTDCISEGQNLQDCDYLINYDIHWNPVRIIQRFGRIDRLGSPNQKIQLVNYWPNISLDDYINLKERVENRMVIADVTATGDDNPLTAKANDVAYRRDQLQQLQDEVIELEDVKTGVSITDLGLNDFRMDLLNYVKEQGEIRNAAKGMHAVVPAGTTKALKPGIIFALRNIHDDVNINQQNRLHPYYLVYIGNDGEILAKHTEVKHVLDLVRTACRGRNQPAAQVYRLFNKLTDDGRKMKAQSELLTSVIASIIEVKEEKDLDSLFTGGATSALVHEVKGLDDFELVAFLVVQAAGSQ